MTCPATCPVTCPVFWGHPTPPDGGPAGGSGSSCDPRRNLFRLGDGDVFEAQVEGVGFLVEMMDLHGTPPLAAIEEGVDDAHETRTRTVPDPENGVSGFRVGRRHRTSARDLMAIDRSYLISRESRDGVGIAGERRELDLVPASALVDQHDPSRPVYASGVYASSVHASKPSGQVPSIVQSIRSWSGASTLTCWIRTWTEVGSSAGAMIWRKSRAR